MFWRNLVSSDSCVSKNQVHYLPWVGGNIHPGESNHRTNSFLLGTFCLRWPISHCFHRTSMSGGCDMIIVSQIIYRWPVLGTFFTSCVTTVWLWPKFHAMQPCFFQGNRKIFPNELTNSLPSILGTTLVFESWYFTTLLLFIMMVD